MHTGYIRLSATGAGETAAELWQQIRAQSESTGSTEMTATAIAVFDRTVYLSLPTTGRWSQSSVVAVGVERLRAGPLLTHVETPLGFSFRTHCQLGSTCRLQVDRTGAIDVRIGPTLVVRLQPDMFETPTYRTDLPQYSCRRFSVGSELLRTHARLLAWLTDQGITDGIGHLDALQQCWPTPDQPSYDSAPSSFVNFVAAVVTAVAGPNHHLTATLPEPNDQQTPRGTAVYDLSTPQSYLGYGPGATPAGDDVLAGLLVTLQGCSDDRLQGGVDQFTDRLLADAETRSTAMSVALLTQAATGRAAEPIRDCLDAVVDPQSSFETLKRAADAVLDIGHTSGAASLAGMLTATLVVFPHCHQHSR